jgi:Lytic polysaccharide mono-oxygenase, cellulose-degrading
MHELGGLYGEGVIVQNYTQGQVISVIVMITANHRGYFEFKICNLDANGYMESEDCFAQHHVMTENGDAEYHLPSDEMKPFMFTLKLPEDLVCQHCVLQWTYVTGNNWGYCDEANTIGALGCGIQENFRTCSDIAISPAV